MSAQKQLEFYFDYGSPYSYLADTQLDQLCERNSATLLYKPVLIGGIFKTTGNTAPMNNPVQSKVQYGMRDLQHWVDYYQCPFNFNPHFPVNTLKLMRLACVLQENNIFPAFHKAAFKAVWVEERNMSEDIELGNLLSELKLDASRLLDEASCEENKEKLKTQTQAAVDRRIFGLPSFVVEDELFFGNDRLPLVEHYLKKNQD